MTKSISSQSMKSSKTPSKDMHVKPMLFNELAMRYVSTHSDHLSAEILNNRISDLSEQLLSFFGHYQVTDINIQRLRKFVFMLETNGNTEKKINAYLVTFRACMRFGLINKWLTDVSMTKPLLNLNETLLPDQSMLTENEFSSLYQGLVQDISHGTFH